MMVGNERDEEGGVDAMTLSVPVARPWIRRELARKAFHVSSASLPLLVWLAPRWLALAVLLPMAAVAVGVDWTRLRFRAPRYWFLRYTRRMLRHHERRKFAGATYMAVAYALALVLFPKPIAVMAMLFNGFGDAAAALVGKRFGRRRTAWGKSWEGFAAGLAVNLAVAAAISSLAPTVPLLAAAAGATAAAVLEFLDLPIDDNVRVTLGGGGVVFLIARLLA
ncbi:MAG TPA: phosphatidate cytidylyltransferase [Longimicrobiaceae bacterium]|nr:phosphatidate cytidylyltransferase [Longimicrobiaceae bacterium]